MYQMIEYFWVILLIIDKKINHIINLTIPEKKEMPTQQEVNFIVEKVQKCRHRDRPRIEMRQLSQLKSAQEIVQYINKMMQKQSFLFDDLIKYTLDVVHLFDVNFNEQSAKIQQLNHLLQQKSDKIQELTQKIQIIQKKLQEQMKQNVQNQQVTQILKSTIEDLHRNIQQQKNQINSRMKQEQNMSEKNMKAQSFSQIKQNNQSMRQEIQNASNEKKAMEMKVLQLQNLVKIRQEEIIKKQKMMKREIQKRQKAERISMEKQGNIQDLLDEIQALKQSYKNSFQVNPQLFQLPEDFRSESSAAQYGQRINNKISLDQDIDSKPIQYRVSDLDSKITQKIKSNIEKQNNNLPFKSDINVNLQQLKPHRAVSSKSNITKRYINLDPYFCHFILLSQAIVIKQNNESFFNIDIKPFYKWIINEKVPMNEWSDWILAKFRQVSEQNQKEDSQSVMKNLKSQERMK